MRTSKGGNVFCYPENIPAQMDRLFGNLRAGEIFRDQSADQFLSSITQFLSELNAIHPFREGNGRSQLAFLGLIGATFERPFDFQKLNRTTFMPAMIASFSGDQTPLRAELKKLLA